MKIAITGHRPNKIGNDYDLTSPLLQKIKYRIITVLGNTVAMDASNPTPTLITGMALGIDTLFAKIAISLNLPFIAAIPCINHSSKWPQKSKDVYYRILQHDLCDTKYVTLEEYNPKVMQIRNEWMVDNCDVLIAVWDKTSGGTANCVKYAQSMGKEIIYIDPNNLS